MEHRGEQRWFAKGSHLKSLTDEEKEEMHAEMEARRRYVQPVQDRTPEEIKQIEEERKAYQERMIKKEIYEANIKQIKDEMKNVVGENFSKLPAFEEVAKAYFNAKSKNDFITNTRPKQGRTTLPLYQLKKFEQELFDADGNKKVDPVKAVEEAKRPAEDYANDIQSSRMEGGPEQISVEEVGRDATWFSPGSEAEREYMTYWYGTVYGGGKKRKNKKKKSSKKSNRKKNRRRKTRRKRRTMK